MLTLCGFAASRFAGPAFGCPAAFGLVFASPKGALSGPSRAAGGHRGAVSLAALPRWCAIPNRREGHAHPAFPAMEDARAQATA